MIQNCTFCWKYRIFPKNIVFSSCLSKISCERSICWRSFKHILSKAVTGGKLHKIAIYWYWFSDFATFNTTLLTRCWWFQWSFGGFKWAPYLTDIEFPILPQCSTFNIFNALLMLSMNFFTFKCFVTWTNLLKLIFQFCGIQRIADEVFSF